MRPVNKYPIGALVRLDDGTGSSIEEEYKPYGKARPYLLNNFGDICSYCENSLHNGSLFDTEHIRPKGKHPELQYKWNNFLIGCRTCNGPGGKWEDDIPEGAHLPHINNTYKSIIYKEGGVVDVNPSLEGVSSVHARSLIDWLKLDKSPKSSEEDKDGRCKMRRETWQIASVAKDQYASGHCSLDMLIILAKARGGWSIWFTVFKGYDEVRKALIEEFPGTATNCFDPDNHYEPVDRNPGAEDPV